MRADLMDCEIPSIWCEINKMNEKNLLICGFYREWSHEGERSAELQMKAIQTLNRQIEKATSENNFWDFILGPMHLFPSRLLSFLVTLSSHRYNLFLVPKSELHTL